MDSNTVYIYLFITMCMNSTSEYEYISIICEISRLPEFQRGFAFFYKFYIFLWSLHLSFDSPFVSS